MEPKMIRKRTIKNGKRRHKGEQKRNRKEGERRE